MPNRNIKESICTSETLDKLTAEEERLFYRIMVKCDDYGRMESHPHILKTQCLPWKTDVVKDEQVESWLNGLKGAGLITIYQVGEKRYLQMNTWEKHQQVRAQHSKFPAPEDGLIADAGACEQMISNDNPSGKVKVGHGEFQNVMLTEEQRAKLNEKLGADKAADLIEQLSTYMRQNVKNAKKYTDHYATILAWSRMDGRRDNGAKSGTHRRSAESEAERLRASINQ